MKVMDISNIANKNFDAVHKSVGVLLHDSGFMRYRKLTAKNYEYWYYEVEDIKKINKKNITYDWSDMELTQKFDFLLSLLKFHKQEESIYKIINNALNLIASKQDGKNIKTGRRCFDEVWDMYYGHWKHEPKQQELF